MPKYLLTFEKNEPVRWLGHLDILRTFERAIRRAGLPVAFSGGFNPRERLAFASALATGITGANELVSIELIEVVAPDKMVCDLNATLPAGLRICACREIPEAGSRDLLNAYCQAEYEVVCDYPASEDQGSVVAAVDELLKRESINITREREGRVRTTDVRPLLHRLELSATTLGERLCLTMILSLGETGTLRPAEVVSLLAETSPQLRFRRAHRVRLLMKAEGSSQCDTNDTSM